MGQRSDIPLPVDPYRLTVVLVGTSHLANLGAVCRGMLNHGFDRLRLVNPQCDIDDEARNRAKHAGSILDDAEVYATLDEAVSDATLVVGTSGSVNSGRKTVFRHFMYPWDLGERLEQGEGTSHLFFGEEGKGLSHEGCGPMRRVCNPSDVGGLPDCEPESCRDHFLYGLHRTRVLERQGNDPALPPVVPLEVRNNPQVRQAFRDSVD